ncbi:MAG TPA: hypothetical protein VFA41_10205 [Ktedonobacteraceae bacterium]|nr:hypothetical protein [Ktedonobacteraceae bacterium]
MMVEQGPENELKTRVTYKDGIWLLEAAHLLIRIPDAVYQRHVETYLKERGVPILSHTEATAWVNWLMDERMAAHQALQKVEYWRQCNDPDIHIWDFQEIRRRMAQEKLRR